MSIPYKIDPVKATCAKYDCTDQGIQGINDTCFGICASYSGTYDTFNMDPECTASCTELIEQRKREIFGVGSCDHQVPYRPVAWEQVPNYFPNLLRNGLSPESALRKCVSLCQSSNLKEECQEKCQVDFNALDLSVAIENVAPESVFVSKSKKDKIEIGGIVLLLIIIICISLFFYLKK